MTSSFKDKCIWCNDDATTIHHGSLFCDECALQAREDERESQESKHCDTGYMNDVRFGDGE